MSHGNRITEGDQPALRSVVFRPAVAWSCEDCGQENYRQIAVIQLPGRVFDNVPEAVKCRQCGATFSVDHENRTFEFAFEVNEDHGATREDIEATLGGSGDEDDEWGDDDEIVLVDDEDDDDDEDDEDEDDDFDDDWDDVEDDEEDDDEDDPEFWDDEEDDDEDDDWDDEEDDG